MNRAQFHEALRRVCLTFDVSESEVMGRSRVQDVAWARQVLYYALRSCCWRVEDIGEAMGRNHSTVCIGAAQVRRRITSVGVDRELVACITDGLADIRFDTADTLSALIARLEARRDALVAA
jgi:chromosomal replication initiation ATPase DnaA